MQHNVTQCSTMYCATSQCSGVMRQQKVIESWIKVSLCHLCSSLLLVQGDRATMCHLVEVPSIYWRIYKDEPTALDLVTLCHLPAPTYSVSLLCQLSLRIQHNLAPYRPCLQEEKKTTTVPGYSVMVHPSTNAWLETNVYTLLHTLDDWTHSAKGKDCATLYHGLHSVRAKPWSTHFYLG